MPLPSIDPAAAWGRWEVGVRLGTRRICVPYAPAGDWMLAAWHGGGVHYLLELGAPEDTEWLAEALLEGDVSMETANAGGREALGAASGWRWWIAENLILGLGSMWAQAGGELMLRGVRVTEVGIAEYLAAAYAMLTRNAKPEDVAKFDQRLVLPPPGIEDDDELREEMARIMFADMIAGGTSAAPFPG